MRPHKQSNPRPTAPWSALLPALAVGCASLACVRLGALGIPLSLGATLLCSMLTVGLAACLAVSLLCLRLALAACAAVSLVALSLSLSAYSWLSGLQSIQSMRVATPVVAAARLFREERGRYPRTISELVPDYLGSAPNSRMGMGLTPFLFASDSTGFSVGFAVPGRMRVCGYDSSSGKWGTSD